MGDCYILDENHQPVPVDCLDWAVWFDDIDKRRVAETFTEVCWISTVFLGVDHGWHSDRPILFETMVFEKEPHLHEIFGEMRETRESLDCYRYATWDEAKTGHARIVMDIVRAEQLNYEAIRKVLEKHPS